MRDWRETDLRYWWGDEWVGIGWGWGGECRVTLENFGFYSSLDGILESMHFVGWWGRCLVVTGSLSLSSLLLYSLFEINLI